MQEAPVEHAPADPGDHSSSLGKGEQNQAADDQNIFPISTPDEPESNVAAGGGDFDLLGFEAPQPSAAAAEASADPFAAFADNLISQEPACEGELPVTDPFDAFADNVIPQPQQHEEVDPFGTNASEVVGQQSPVQEETVMLDCGASNEQNTGVIDDHIEQPNTIINEATVISSADSKDGEPVTVEKFDEGADTEPPDAEVNIDNDTALTGEDMHQLDDIIDNGEMVNVASDENASKKATDSVVEPKHENTETSSSDARVPSSFDFISNEQPAAELEHTPEAQVNSRVNETIIDANNLDSNAPSSFGFIETEQSGEADIEKPSPVEESKDGNVINADDIVSDNRNNAVSDDILDNSEMVNVASDENASEKPTDSVVEPKHKNNETSNSDSRVPSSFDFISNVQPAAELEHTPEAHESETVNSRVNETIIDANNHDSNAPSSFGFIETEQSGEWDTEKPSLVEESKDGNDINADDIVSANTVRAVSEEESKAVDEEQPTRDDTDQISTEKAHEMQSKEGDISSSDNSKEDPIGGPNSTNNNNEHDATEENAIDKLPNDPSIQNATTEEEAEWLSMGLGLADALRQIISLTEERDVAIAMCQEREEQQGANVQSEALLVEVQSRLQSEMDRRAESDLQVRKLREDIQKYQDQLQRYSTLEDDYEQAKANLVMVVSEKSKLEAEIVKLREFKDESEQKEVLLSNRLNEAKKKEANKGQAAGRLEAENESLKEELEKTKAELNALTQAKAKVESNMEKLKSKAVERVKQAETALAEERELNEERKRKMKTFVESKADELREAKESASDMQIELQETRTSLRASRDREESIQQELEASRIKYRELQREMERLKRSQQEMHKMGSTLEHELEKRDSETEEHKKKRMSAKHELMTMVRTLEVEKSVNGKLRESIKFTFTPKALSQQQLLSECLKDFEVELERLAAKLGKTLSLPPKDSEAEPSDNADSHDVNGSSQKGKRTRGAKADTDTERLISTLEQETQHVSKGIMSFAGSIERMRSLMDEDHTFNCMAYFSNIIAAVGHQEARHQRLGNNTDNDEREETVSITSFEQGT